MLKKFIYISVLFLMVQAPKTRAYQQAPETAAKATYIQAMQAFENEQYQQALTLLESVYPQLSENGGVNFALADIYFQLEKMPDAVHYAKQAIKTDLSNKWYRLKLVEVYEATGQNQEVIQQLENARTDHPGDRQILNKLAIAYANEGELEKARQQYNRLIHLGGTEITLRMQKLKIFSLQSRDDSLAAELKKILDLNPQRADTFELLSNYYEEIGDNQQAQQMLKKAGRHQLDDINTLQMRAKTYISAAKWDSLRRLGISVMADSVLSAGEKLQFAETVFESYRNSESPDIPADAVGELMDKLLQNEGKSVQARTLAADFYIAAGLNEQALTQLAKINATNPGNREAWIKRLQALMAENKTESAIQAGLQANEHLPQDAYVHYAVGYSYLAEDNFPKAADWLNKAAKLPARSSLKSNIFKSLGETYFTLEQWQNAFYAFKNAFDYGKQNAELMEHIGDALAKLNKPQEAKGWWKKALQKDPDNLQLQEKLSE